MTANQFLTQDQSAEFQDKEIQCVDCGEKFIWTAGEQVFYYDK